MKLREHYQRTIADLGRRAPIGAATFLLACAERQYSFYAAYCERRKIARDLAVRGFVDELWALLAESRGTEVDTTKFSARFLGAGFGPDLAIHDRMIDTHAHMFLILVDQAAGAAAGHIDYRNALNQVFTQYAVLLPPEVTDLRSGEFLELHDEPLSQEAATLKEISYQERDLADLDSGGAFDEVTFRIRDRAQRESIANTVGVRRFLS